MFTFDAIIAKTTSKAVLVCIKKTDIGGEFWLPKSQILIEGADEDVARRRARITKRLVEKFGDTDETREDIEDMMEGYRPRATVTIPDWLRREKRIGYYN